jgi:transposase-like protein
MAKKEIKRHPAANAIADLILQNYEINNAKDIHEAIKDAFGPLFEKMLDAEMDAHLGYSKSSPEIKDTDNRRNGYTEKTIRTSMGETTIKTPRDRNGSFEPVIVPKRTKDVTDVENKVLSMYARGMSQRDISATIEDLYGFTLSQDKISSITDSVLDDVHQWQNRPLKPLYTFVFVDCIYVKIKNDRGTVDNNAIYVLLGVDLEGRKEVLGLYGGDTESKSRWLQIFDEIKARGVEDILFLSMDGVSGLEEGVKLIYPQTVVQRCIVHLIRNSVKYIPSKYLKDFCKDCKSFYGAVSLEACDKAFELFKDKWKDSYPGAVKVWDNNFNHVRQLYSYPSAVRRIMYTTNAIESVNSSLRKVTKKGMFENQNAVFKIFYLRITRELAKKWDGSKLTNWPLVLNQLSILDETCDRITKYL